MIQIMRTVTDSVRHILFSSDTALEALRNGILNLSAYAHLISPQVEQETWKSVKTGTITVALSRIASEVTAISPLRPKVRITNLSIQSDLCDISFEKSESLLEKLPSLQNSLTHQGRSVFVETVGLSEVTFIISSDLKDDILELLQVEPKSVYSDLVGITVGFEKQYLVVPNVIYSLISTVAAKRINIVEIVSTYTELMFVIEARDGEECMRALESHFHASKP